MVLGALAAAVLLQTGGAAPDDQDTGRGRSAVPVTEPWRFRPFVGLAPGVLAADGVGPTGTLEVGQAVALGKFVELRAFAHVSVLAGLGTNTSLGGVGALGVGWFGPLGIGLGGAALFVEPSHAVWVQALGSIRVRLSARIAHEVSIDGGPFVRSDSSFGGAMARLAYSVSFGVEPLKGGLDHPAPWRGFGLGAGLTLTQMLSTGTSGFTFGSPYRQSAGRPWLPMLTLEGVGALGLGRWVELQAVLTLGAGVVPADSAVVLLAALGARATLWLTPSYGVGLATDAGISWHGAPVGSDWFRGIVLLPQVRASVVVAHLRWGAHRLVLGLGTTMLFASQFFVRDEAEVGLLPLASLTWSTRW